MEDTIQMLDPEVAVVDFDANHSPVEKALQTLDGGARNTQTHISIGIYQKNSRAYFT